MLKYLMARAMQHHAGMMEAHTMDMLKYLVAMGAVVMAYAMAFDHVLGLIAR